MTALIHVLGTGGTISCTHDTNGDLVPTYSTAELLQQAGLDDPNIHATDILHRDSSDIDLADMDTIFTAIHQARINGAKAIIVLHGTDTLEETATAAALLLSHPEKPIIFTGAQRPADDPHPDGHFNLHAAINTARAYCARLNTLTEAQETAASTDLAHSALPCVPVSIVFGGKIIPAFGATKIHTTNDQAFDLVQPAPNATGNNSPVETAAFTTPPALQGFNVPIIYAYAGATHGIALQDIPTSGIDGVVIAGMGSGNIPHSWTPLLKTLKENNIPVTLTTRVPSGSVEMVYGGQGGGADLARQGVTSAGSLTPQAARMQLITHLAWIRQQGNAYPTA